MFYDVTPEMASLREEERAIVREMADLMENYPNPRDYERRQEWEQAYAEYGAKQEALAEAKRVIVQKHRQLIMDELRQQKPLGHIAESE